MKRHSIFAVWLLAAALPVSAQQSKLPAQPPKPPALQPVPEPPPPPPGYGLDTAVEPQVTIIKRGTDTVEEFRIGGRLYMMKVTPAHGVPYYLVDYKGDGTFTRQESYDTGLRPPMWVIMQF